MMVNDCDCPSAEEIVRAGFGGEPVDPYRCATHYGDIHAERQRVANQQHRVDELDRLRHTLADAGHPGAQAGLDRQTEANRDPLEKALTEAVGQPRLRLVQGGASSMPLNAATADIARLLGMNNADNPNQPLPPLDAA